MHTYNTMNVTLLTLSHSVNQLYLSFGEHFQPGGPLIVIVGGQTWASEYALTESLVMEVAREQRGYVFMLEHRFYGRSQPFA